jgi:hypothetical protein
LECYDYPEGSETIDEAIYDWAKEFSSAGVMAGKKYLAGELHRVASHIIQEMVLIRRI